MRFSSAKAAGLRKELVLPHLVNGADPDAEQPIFVVWGITFDIPLQAAALREELRCACLALILDIWVWI